jgi:hypothetical protein
VFYLIDSFTPLFRPVRERNVGLIGAVLRGRLPHLRIAYDEPRSFEVRWVEGRTRYHASLFGWIDLEIFQRFEAKGLRCRFECHRFDVEVEVRLLQI